MFQYQPGDDVGPLEEWPFDNPASDYMITSGTPRASGRIDAGGAGQTSRMGIWHCTKGVFDCTEQGDELMTILSGTGQVVDHASGVAYPLTPGTSLFLRDGSRVTWHISEDITKVFFGQKDGGY